MPWLKVEGKLLNTVDMLSLRCLQRCSRYVELVVGLTDIELREVSTGEYTFVGHLYVGVF